MPNARPLIAHAGIGQLTRQFGLSARPRALFVFMLGLPTDPAQKARATAQMVREIKSARPADSCVFVLSRDYMGWAE